MHDFGKLTPRKETVEIGEGATVDIMVLYNDEGVEWHDLFKAAGPFDFYVALTDDDRVLSFETDPEHSQLPNHRILGLTAAEAGDFTRGEGGTVYGKFWNGTIITDPVLSRDQYPSLTPVTFWKTAKQIGVTKDEIKAQIMELAVDEDTRSDMLIEIDNCTAFFRLNPTVVAMAVNQNIPPEQLDTLWLWAAKTQV